GAGADIRGAGNRRAGHGIVAAGGSRAGQHVEAGWGIRAGAAIVAAGAIRAGESLLAGDDILAGEGYGVFAGLGVQVDAWEVSARVCAQRKPERLMSGWWDSAPAY